MVQTLEPGRYDSQTTRPESSVRYSGCGRTSVATFRILYVFLVTATNDHCVREVELPDVLRENRLQSPSVCFSPLVGA